MVAKALERPTLVLNRNWQPVNVATVARALVLLWNEAARVVDVADYQTFSWDDWSRLRWVQLKWPQQPLGCYCHHFQYLRHKPRRAK